LKVIWKACTDLIAIWKACTDLIIIWKAESLPPLHCDGDDQEDARGEGEVATAFKEGEDEADEAVIEAKVEGKHKKIRKKKEGISNAETREKLVEQIEHGSGMRNILKAISLVEIVDLSARMLRLRIFPPSPSSERREERTPEIHHLKTISAKGTKSLKTHLTLNKCRCSTKAPATPAMVYLFCQAEQHCILVSPLYHYNRCRLSFCLLSSLL
jgi:hypothetical protein